MRVYKKHTQKTACNYLIDSSIKDCFIVYCFEARYYRAPTFISRDPLMNEKPWLTPYHYCSNNPVGRIDPTGCEDGEFIANGKVIGNDGKNDGKLYVVNNASLPTASYRQTKKFIRQNSGNAAAFANNDIAYKNSTEIDASEENRQAMIDIVSQDNGKGGMYPANNREYGGKYNEKGKIIPLPPGAPGDVTQTDHLEYDPTNIFHSHASGTWSTSFDLLSNRQTYGEKYETLSWKQEPSKADINNCGNRTRYVFGMGNRTVYIYTREGVKATIPMNCFVNPLR